MTAVLSGHSDAVDQLIKPFKDSIVIATTDVILDEDIKTLPIYTPEEVALQNGATCADGVAGCTWIVIKDKVYDVSQFMLLEHPGGRDVIEAFAGKQCDWQFDIFHHPRDLEQYEDQLLIGYVSPVPPNPFPRPPRERKADWRVE